MKEIAVFEHLDVCKGGMIEPAIQPASLGHGRTGVSLQKDQRQLSKPKNNIERLAPLSYSLLKEATLRKKLCELGIPHHGNKTALELRHREWVTIWNANCDAAKPRERTALLRDLDAWERVRTSQEPFHTPKWDVRNKNFDREEYSLQHNHSYQKLIARAREEASSRAESLSDSDYL
jgi:E3 ubiquitin-protein ligase RAD18